MSLIAAEAPKNLLLRSLLRDDWMQLQSHLTPVTLNVRDVLVEPFTPIRHVDFVESGLLSIVATAGDRQIEVATVGYEGMSGVSLVHGIAATPQRTFVQIAGSALRVDASVLLRFIQERPTLHRSLLLFAHTLQVQMAHTALVNGHFTVEQRLARWILVCQDKMGGNELPLTHEFLAIMLGVRRAGVTVAIHMLEGEGMIRATRGRIRIRDRPRLIRKAGGSYGLPEAEYERAIGLNPCKVGAPPRSLKAKRVLVAEDEYELAQEMTHTLEGFGAEVVGPCPRVQDALSLLIAAPSLDGAVVDINLQGEMAFPLAEALQKRRVPFVFVSGCERSFVPKQFVDVEFYQKPVKPSDVAVGLMSAR